MEYGLVALWAAVYLLLAAATFPLTSLLLRPVPPTAAAALSFPLSFLLLFFPVYWVGQVTFGPVTAVFATLVVAALSALATRFGGLFDSRGYRDAALVFLAAFAFLLAIRAVEPAAYPGGGEKFLDFGLLKSLLRADSLPPESMWFAGESVKYYYGGHLVAATLTELTATPGRYAYNLALAGFYATEVVAVYGLAAALADARSLPTRTAGLAGAFLFGFASNLFTSFRFLMGFLPEGFTSGIANAVALRWESVTVSLSDFSYWDASRVIPGTINEFPLFAYLNGDLHGHMLSPVAMVLVAAAAFAYYRTPRGHTRRRVGTLAFAALAAGMVAVMNTWSLPAALGVVGLAVTFAPAPAWSLLPERVAARIDALSRPVREALRPVSGVLVAGVVAVGAILAVAPFVPNVLLASESSRSLSFLPERSGALALLLVHGGFLAIFARYLADVANDGRRAAVVALLWALALPVGAYVGFAALFVFIPLLVVCWYLLRRGDAGYETVLILGGTGLVLLVELVYLSAGAGPGRFNTVFKTYAQVWVLWSVAGGAALAAVVHLYAPVRGVPDIPPDAIVPADPVTRSRIRAVAVAVLVCLLSVYGVVALAGHFDGADDPSLDAMAFVESDHPEEAAAIAWLNDRSGRPHIASAPGVHIYQWQSPASSLTGLPTIAGWGHAADYQGGDAYDQRVDDVEQLYNGSAATRAEILVKYDVRYIYYGPIERERYGSFDPSGEPGLELAHESGSVRIYGVDQSAL